MKGFEPSAAGATTQCSNQLSYTHHKREKTEINAGRLLLVARLEGLEPPAHSLEGCCSIRLSYRRLIFFSTFHGLCQLEEINKGSGGQGKYSKNSFTNNQSEEKLLF